MTPKSVKRFSDEVMRTKHLEHDAGFMFGANGASPARAAHCRNARPSPPFRGAIVSANQAAQFTKRSMTA